MSMRVLSESSSNSGSLDSIFSDDLAISSRACSVMMVTMIILVKTCAKFVCCDPIEMAKWPERGTTLFSFLSSTGTVATLCLLMALLHDSPCGETKSPKRICGKAIWQNSEFSIYIFFYFSFILTYSYGWMQQIARHSLRQIIPRFPERISNKLKKYEFLWRRW